MSNTYPSKCFLCHQKVVTGAGRPKTVNGKTQFFHQKCFFEFKQLR
jgi:hypothetical protein